MSEQRRTGRYTQRASSEIVEPRLVCQNLQRQFGDLTVLDDLNLIVAPSEVVSIQGTSGTGKSTLLNCLGLLDRPDSGQILLEGTDVGQLSNSQRARLRARRLGFVFQGAHLLPEFDVLDNVLMPARCAGMPVKWCRDRALQLLRDVGLGTHEHAQVGTLSGGERQRVALCRALLTNPGLVLADEPTGNLDPATATVVLELFLHLAANEGSSVVLVTHDPILATRAHRRLELKDGRLSPVRD